MTDTKTKIIDIAESLIKTRGYAGFSFREIANEIGIKSASVHYHFPSKADLAVAIMVRYRQKFMQALNSIEQNYSDPKQRLVALIDFYNYAISNDRSLTFCMMVGHDRALVPLGMSEELNELVDDVIKWLSKLSLAINPELNAESAQSKACFIHACLQGGILGSSAIGDADYFEKVKQQLLGLFGIDC